MQLNIREDVANSYVKISGFSAYNFFYPSAETFVIRAPVWFGNGNMNF